MTLSARDIANRQQRIASDPGVSAFVSASAGSGKTKLLTDRLLRLMLGGAQPGRIQCLTFTKAAAAEMALRLQKRLGAWVTMGDARLDAELAALDVIPTPELRDQARALFGVVLDLPGGMRIGTIHAFCQSLLRRFPLEAQLSPHFELADDRDQAIAWQQARETMLAGSHTPERRSALERLAGQASLGTFGGLVQLLQTDRARLEAVATRPDPLGALMRVLRATTPHTLGDDAIWQGERDLRLLFEEIKAKATKSSIERAERVLAWLSLPAEAREENWGKWRREFFADSGAARALGAFVHHTRQDRFPDLERIVTAEQDRIRRIEDGWKAHEVAELSDALLTLALPVTQAYAAGKTLSLRLDYEDLIARTAQLLVDPGAAWVMFKLDGGLDHLLLDEVQDTAPAQWRIAASLTAEFFTGLGARPDVSRTVFAVGDRKQSIYGFQGADPDAFEHWRGVLRRRVESSGQEWRDVSLDVSFRSTAPVLKLVDAVFAQNLASPGVAEDGALHHIADRAAHAGRCEIWPLVPKPDSVSVSPWDVPRENLRQISAMQRLADALAEWIAAQITTGARLESQDRPIGAGDFLVLVRRRNAFPAALVRALKTRGVKVAGLDRMVLTAQPAIADLMTLCDTLLLPQDDLSLACVLTSPLGGLSDDRLMELAPLREGSLWDALRASDAPDCQAAVTFIATLLSRVDHASPHALLSEALGRLGGRARLLARLGPEAAEPIDELLSAALRHAQTHPPSLQGFLHWLRQSAAEVKREPEGPGGEGFDAVRIMTVHGAKGLQAPVVILPDTTSLPPGDEPIVWAVDPSGALPIWSPRDSLRCDAARELRKTLLDRQAEEQNRLLYVALTRAEDRLLVCGWDTGREQPTTWYNHVKRGFEALAAETARFAEVAEPWPGDVMRLASPQEAEPVRKTEGAVRAVPPLPHWTGRAPLWRPAPPPVEPPLPTPLAPSRPDGVSLGDIPQAASPLAQRDASGARFRRGQLIHSLLQHLPDLPPHARAPAALRHVTQAGQDIADAHALVAEVMEVLDHPDLATLFGPSSRAEIPLTGVIAGQVIGGMVDRLGVEQNRVIIADYKTNRLAPKTPEDVTVLYLRQMAAYRALLAAIHPTRDIECWLIWTVGAQMMALPPALLDRHAPGAARAA